MVRVPFFTHKKIFGRANVLRIQQLLAGGAVMLSDAEVGNFDLTILGEQHV